MRHAPRRRKWQRHPGGRTSGFRKVDATCRRFRMSRWLAEGRTLGQSLRRFHAIVVAGGSADAVADVALGIAESQAAIRHVVLGDLLGDSPKYAQFRSDEDPHGLVDAFDYGISLGRVARPIPDNPRLQFVA